MKPERVDLQGVIEVREVVERVLQTRLREATGLAASLERRDKGELHDFRIACKRLRYALERFAQIEPAFQVAAERLALLQDALGETHDRDVLLAILPPPMERTKHRLRSEREAHVDRAVALWDELQGLTQNFDSHRI
jgi:CHAD domain-containing protein